MFYINRMKKAIKDECNRLLSEPIYEHPFILILLIIVLPLVLIGLFFFNSQVRSGVVNRFIADIKDWYNGFVDVNS
jgi:flagellar basal body-associated protein FliL